MYTVYLYYSSEPDLHELPKGVAMALITGVQPPDPSTIKL